MRWAGARDKDHLLQIARNEKSQELRLYAIRMLGPPAPRPNMAALPDRNVA